jgi:hypothetical protein
VSQQGANAKGTTMALNCPHCHLELFAKATLLGTNNIELILSKNEFRFPIVVPDPLNNSDRALNNARSLNNSTAQKRGRPRISELRPWDLEGVSRRTWYRRNPGGITSL